MTEPMFNEIGGYEYPKSEALKVVNFLKKYDDYHSKGAKLPQGIIFYGDPGTGKTMFAKAIANESGVEMFSLTTDEFYNDSNISIAIQNVFSKAKECAPSIVLIDEIDRLVDCDSRRGSTESDKQREALRVLLTEIDKANDAGILVIATANADLRYIPGALIRNGRIEKHIEIGTPSKEDRKEILSIYLANHDVFKNINVDDVVAYTAGFSGASLSSLVNEVLIYCITNNKEASFNDFLEPIESIRNHGIKKKSDSNNDSVIYHEIGHFIADYVLNNQIGMINVVPYGETNGRYGLLDYDGSNVSKKANKSKTDIMNECIIAVSGLVATELFMGEAYIGAFGDLERVTSAYVSMAKSGLLDNYSNSLLIFGTIGFDSPFADSSNFVTEQFGKFLDDLKAKSKELLLAKKDLVEALFKELKLKSVLTHNEIEEVINRLEA